ncbi:MAG: ATP-binding protein [Pyrinomonadaceae bacterium]
MGEKIIATIAPENFIGRTGELDALLRHTRGESKTNALLLLSAPAVGASELLKQTYDQIFIEQTETIPVYFAVKEFDRTVRNCASRFLQTFLAQIIAFRRNDSSILNTAPNVCEIAELADANDGYWIDQLVEACGNESRLNDERSFVRSCLSAPLRADANGAKVFLMIDDLHEAENFADEIDFIGELKEIYSRANIRFVFAGRRRFLSNAAQTGSAKITGAEIIRLEPLAFSDAKLFVENLAEKYAVEINEQTGDLIAEQFKGNPAFIKFLFQAANEHKSNLDSFQQVEKIYAVEIFGGRIKRFYDSIFRKAAPRLEKNIIEFLNDALMIEEKSERPHLEDVFQSQQLNGAASDKDLHRLLSLLNWHEIIRLSSNRIEAMSENDVLNDYIRARYRLETLAENRAAVFGETLSEFIIRAPKTMAKFYRRQASVNLREILSNFDCQETPVALLDYSIFKERYKGADETEIFDGNSEKIRLPQIVFNAPAAAFYPAIIQVAEKERVAVALGFEKRAYTEEDKTVWIAAEIDSKLEASPETTEFWCDRLEMIALARNFPKYKLWLVAPEGFAPEAAEILQTRNAFGSSRKQVELLRKFLGAKDLRDEETSGEEYEIIVPMGDDAELIVAHALEEIARKHQFEPKAINQIKTALVEACINATEHSLSPDRKIYQKFIVENDKIIITISNRGLRLADKKAEAFAPEEGRRGWGLKLIKSLMDEVKFESVDDGTRISMTKYLKNS